MGMNWRNNIKQSSGKIPKLLQALFKKFNFRTLTPVAESNFLEKKGLDSWNFFSKFRVLETFSNNVKVNPVVSWNGHNSFQRIQFFSISAFYYTSASGAFPFIFFSSKRAVQIFLRNIVSLNISLEDWWMHSVATGIKHVKPNSERTIPSKSSESWRVFRRNTSEFQEDEIVFLILIKGPARKQKPKRRNDAIGEPSLRNSSWRFTAPECNGPLRSRGHTCWSVAHPCQVSMLSLRSRNVASCWHTAVIWPRL